MKGSVQCTVLCVLLGAVLNSASAAAQETKSFDASTFPAGVQQALQHARDECKLVGGGDVRFAANTVRALDLAGKGRTDYIVDLRDAACQDREAVYCGTGGCEVAIVVTRRGGTTRLVFAQQVRDYEILPGSGARTIRFTLHGAYCGGHGNPSCIKIHRITSQPFKFNLPE